MRTIKFRGKRLDNGKWMWGGIDQNLNQGKVYIINYESGYSLEIDPSTVGQSTGLLDKNGKEIYEGDIICESVDGITTDWMVRYDTSLAEYRAENIGDECDDIQLNDVWLDKSEIIGNIHDNPELLTEK